MQDALGNPQSALVLGGGSDIALATVRALIARRLRTVVLAGRDTEALEQAADELRRLGAATVEVEPFDALDVAGHDALVDRVFDRHPHLDLVVQAFGVLGHGAERWSATQAADVVTTNYVAGVTTGLAVARRFRQAGHGVLVVLSSVAAERPRRQTYVYGSSKAGLDAFAQGLGDDLVGSGARVMIVRPGFVHTSMTEGRTPSPGSTTPDAVAEAIVAGLGKGADVVHVPALLRVVFSGLRHLPRPVWRRLPLG